MSEHPTGIVFDIKKFAIHDGPGIRTTVFLKGCPLSCQWCHNPESQDQNIEISFNPEKCIGCGYCLKICPNGCHALENGLHVYDRTHCVQCGLCARECYAQSIEVIGQSMTVDEVIEEVMKDLPFYETSDGGMTISGGEPMSQFEFTKALLVAAKKNNLHTCLDTSGHAFFERYQQLLQNVDIFLYDIKETNPQKHAQVTGVPMERIQENLRALDAAGARTILRCPVIPGLNDRPDHFKAIANTANSSKNVIGIDIHPYHPLGTSKSERIGKRNAYDADKFPEDKTVDVWMSSIRKQTDVDVKKA